MLKEIDFMRAEISILNEISKGVNVKTRMSRNIKKKYKISDENTLLIAKESLKQRMQVKAQRLRPLEKRGRSYRQNKVFQTNAKKFYREIGKGKIDLEEPLAESEIKEVWNSVWGKEIRFNNVGEWMDRGKQNE